METSQKATEWKRGSTFHEKGETKEKPAWIVRKIIPANGVAILICNFAALESRLLTYEGRFVLQLSVKTGLHQSALKKRIRGERGEKKDQSVGWRKKGEESGGERIVTGKNKATHAHTVCPWVTRTYDSSCIQRTWSERREKVLSSWTLINAHFFCDRLFDVNMTSPAAFALSNLRGLFTCFFRFLNCFSLHLPSGTLKTLLFRADMLWKHPSKLLTVLKSAIQSIEHYS